MKQERIMTVLRSPHMSEKSTRVADAYRHMVFKVASDATKPEIKQAVETLFKVKVEHVRVLNVKGKRKMAGRGAGRRYGCRASWKKAYVKLAPDHDLDFVGGLTAA